MSPVVGSFRAGTGERRRLIVYADAAGPLTLIVLPLLVADENPGPKINPDPSDERNLCREPAVTVT